MFQKRSKNAVIRALYYITGMITVRFGSVLKNPLFIVGTGRCGTTLLMSILKSHPDILGFPGEANELWHPKLVPYNKSKLDTPPIEIDPEKFTEVSIQSWRFYQTKKIRHIFNGFYLIEGNGKRFFVKSATISFMIPKIVEIFPDARFIHVYRIGPSVVESYVKRNFGKYTRYTFEEDEYRLYCAKYWNSCILEIERASNSLSLGERGAYFELSYEALYDDPQEMVEKMARYIGVDRNAFAFDLSSIRSTNYKVGDYAREERWKKSLEAMYPAMKLKGYV